MSSSITVKYHSEKIKVQKSSEVALKSLIK